MRSEYSIVIDTQEREHFKDVLTRTNAKWQAQGGHSGTITYQVSLSKYELLYLRLACKVGKIKALNETTEVA
jgi:hypothetical protein